MTSSGDNLADSLHRSPADSAGAQRTGATLLAVDPGSTGTKVALVHDDEVIARESLPATPESTLSDRLRDVSAWLARYDGLELDAVVGRGGMVRPIPGGVYTVTDELAADLRLGVRGTHPSNMGGLIARALGDARGIPSYIVDPVASDEFWPPARVAGIAQLRRISMLHALNVKSVARRDCEARGVRYEDANLVVAHLGGGISIVAIRDGRLVDANNANEEGPFSPSRCGGLPTGQVGRLVTFKELPTEAAARRFLLVEGGVKAYLGTDDMREVEARAASGDAQAAEVLDAMAYQIGKCIGSYAAALGVRPDAILITGGVARCTPLVDAVEASVGWIAPVRRYPGEFEIEALTDAVERVLAGEETARDYATELENMA